MKGIKRQPPGAGKLRSLFGLLCSVPTAFLLTLVSLLSALAYAVGIDVPFNHRALCGFSIAGLILGLIAAAVDEDQRTAGLVVAGIACITVVAWALASILGAPPMSVEF